MFVFSGFAKIPQRIFKMKTQIQNLQSSVQSAVHGGLVYTIGQKHGGGTYFEKNIHLFCHASRVYGLDEL